MLIGTFGGLFFSLKLNFIYNVVTVILKIRHIISGCERRTAYAKVMEIKTCS